MIELGYYRDEKGRSPFIEWLHALRDKVTKARIDARLRQLQAGNPGDAKSIGEGVYELRFQFGPGYRIYCGRQGESFVLLLCGGDKSSQQQDIQKAREFWDDWKRRIDEQK